MDINAYREEIKLALTGGLLELEIEDSVIDRIINSAFREIQRYIDTTVIRTIPFSRCIDLSEYNVNTVVNVYRTVGTGINNSANAEEYFTVDPMYAQQWQLLSGTGNMMNFQNFALNFASWNTLQQIRNTTSTDLAWKYDISAKKLYINTSLDNPLKITIEYIPRFDNVSEVISDYWIDIIQRLSIAKAKIIVGRIRSKYAQSNALWTLDGATMLQEGLTEEKELRDLLLASTQLIYPID